MGYAVWVFIALLIVYVIGCTSPTDVDASRKRTIIDTPPDILRFVSLPTVLNFGSVRQFASKEMAFICSNYSDEIVTVTSATLLHGNRGFTLLPFTVPMQINPNSLSVNLFSIQFSSQLPGEYNDTLILNKSTKYAIPIYANVRRLSVRTSDIDYGDVKIEQNSSINVEIENLDTVPVTVQSVSNDDVEFAFYIAPIPSFQLQPGEKRNFPVVFTPSKVKKYNAIIRFNIVGATNDVDNEAVVTGSGILD
jgi:hypothetical protein